MNVKTGNGWIFWEGNRRETAVGFGMAKFPSDVHTAAAGVPFCKALWRIWTQTLPAVETPRGKSSFQLFPVQGNAEPFVPAGLMLPGSLHIHPFDAFYRNRQDSSRLNPRGFCFPLHLVLHMKVVCVCKKFNHCLGSRIKKRMSLFTPNTDHALQPRIDLWQPWRTFLKGHLQRVHRGAQPQGTGMPFPVWSIPEVLPGVT